MKCLALVSTWWPTFCVSLWGKTGSLTLMFNSAIVFDERFCLDCDPQGGTSVANLAYILYLWKKVGWNNKCQVWVWAYSHKKYLVFLRRYTKAEVSPQTNRAFLCLWHILLNEESFWMAALWDHIAELDDVSVVIVCVLLHPNTHKSHPQTPKWALRLLFPWSSSLHHNVMMVCICTSDSMHTWDECNSK